MPTEESYPPYPPFLKTRQFPNLKNSSFHCRPCPISHKRRRIDIKAPKRANGIIPHQLPHLDYKTRNKAATIKKRGITEHQTSMHNSIHRCIETQIPMHRNPSWHCDTFWFFVILDTDAYKNPDTDAYKHRCIEKFIHRYTHRCIQTQIPMHTNTDTDTHTDAYKSPCDPRHRCIQKSRRIIISTSKPDTDAYKSPYTITDTDA